MNLEDYSYLLTSIFKDDDSKDIFNKTVSHYVDKLSNCEPSQLLAEIDCMRNLFIELSRLRIEDGVLVKSSESRFYIILSIVLSALEFLVLDLNLIDTKH